MTELLPPLADSVEPDPIELMRQAGYLTPTAFNLPETISFDQYVAIGWKLAERRKHTMWWISEWLLFGERVYGETYAQAAEITGLSPDTLKNYVSTANRVPRERRREELQFSHHQEVASLEPEEQTEWLDRAVVNGWTRAELRAQLLPVKGNIVTPATQVLPTLEEAARALTAAATEYGPDYLVKRHLLTDLRAALGEHDDG